MKSQLFLATFLILLALLATPGCAVKPPDIAVCTEMSMVRGECIRSISGKTFSIDEKNKFEGETWWEMRPTNIIMPLKSWLELKKFIIKLCKKYEGMCEKEVSSWDRSIEVIEEVQKEKTPLVEGSSL